MEASRSNSKIFENSGGFNDASSGKKDSLPVDPRWPLLNRWSKQTESKPIPTEIPKQVEEPFSSMVSDTVGANKTFEATLMEEENPSPGDMEHQNPSTFSTSLGAWKRPLSTLPHTSQLETGAVHLDESNSLAWPPLSRETSGNTNCGHPSFKVKDGKSFSEHSDAHQVSLKAHSKEYPWAARMNQSMRNLHRVTIPEYMEDGTPKVRIPSHVLLGGLENQKEFVIGQFYRCLAPSGGQIQAVVTRIWGRKCRIFTRKLGESTFLFHIPDESTRKWVLQRALWHVDDCLLFVSPWSPTDTISIPEITTVPVWLTLLNIPDQLYSILGIKWIASGIGEPLLTDKPWLDPIQMGKAKILVEVKLDKPFPKRVALIDKSNSITMVDVLYSWLPSTCSGCGQLGHKASRCLVLSAQTAKPLNSVNDHKIVNSADDTNAGRNGTSAYTNEVPAAVSHSATASDSAKHLLKETLETVEEDPILVSPTNSEASDLPGYRTIHTPTTMSLPVTTRNVSNSKSANKVHSNEISTTKHVTPSSKGDEVMRRSSSNLALSTNRFASLDSSDEDDSDDDNVNAALTEVTDTVEYLTSDKRILRPVRLSEKAKEMQWKQVTGGRGNRGRGWRGGRGK